MKGKRFITKVLWDSVVLSALVILPIAFLGPGWKTQTPKDQIARERFQREHASADSPRSMPDRDIPILRAFQKEAGDDNDDPR